MSDGPIISEPQMREIERSDEFATQFARATAAFVIAEAMVKADVNEAKLGRRFGKAWFKRLLSADANPALDTLARIANGFDCHLVVTFKPRVEGPFVKTAREHVQVGNAGASVTVRIGESQRYHLNEVEAEVLRDDLDRALRRLAGRQGPRALGTKP